MEIKLSNKAEKFLRKCEKLTALRIIEELKQLSINPFPKDVKRVQGQGKVFRTRIGDWRVLYEVNSAEQLIQIINIDKRERVYD